VNVLIIGDAYPTPDRNAADLRLSELLSMLAEEHQVFFCPIGEGRQVDAIGNTNVTRYREGLRARGVSVAEGGVTKALRARPYAVVMFEWYFAARDLIDEVRAAQPAARVTIQSPFDPQRIHGWFSVLVHGTHSSQDRHVSAGGAVFKVSRGSLRWCYERERRSRRGGNDPVVRIQKCRALICFYAPAYSPPRPPAKADPARCAR